jgi:hypothetical protein
MLLLLTLLLRSLLRSLLTLLCGPRRLPSRALAVERAIDLQALHYELMGALPPLAPTNVFFSPFIGTFHAVLELLALPAFPFPLLGALHVGSALRVAQPAALTCGARSRQGPARARVAWAVLPGTRQAARGVEVEVTVEVEVAGALQWAATHRYLFPGARLAPSDAEAVLEAAGAAASGAAAAAAAAPPPLPAQPPGAAAAAAAAEGGGALATLPLPLGAELGRAWGALTRDFNPIHVSPLAARALGFRGGVVAHGMAVVLLALRAALRGGAPLGARELEGSALRVAFLRPLMLPDAGASVVVQRGAGGCAVALWVVSRGKVCCTAELAGAAQAASAGAETE